MKLAVLTNDKSLWAIRPFAHLFNKFWSEDQEIDVVGFNKPDFKLSDNFNFVSLDTVNWPSNKWTNQLITYLESIDDKFVTLLLEDFWLDRQVNLDCVNSIESYIWDTNNVLRVDLTADRKSNRLAVEHDITKEGYKLISTPSHSQYQMSYQTATWNRELLLDVLVPNEDAWNSEVVGSERLKQRKDLLVLGSVDYPVHYIPVLRRNKPGLQGYNKFSQQLRNEINPLIPRGFRR